MNFKIIKVLFFIIVLLMCLHVTYGQNSKNPKCHLLNVENFQQRINGKDVSLYFLKKGNVTAAITNYGARIVSLCVPDRNGEFADIVIGFKSIEDYIKASGVYHGAIIGRVAGRIKNGLIELNTTKYALQLNNGKMHLHGGANGFHSQVWDVKSQTDSSLVLSYFSKDGEMGYPGNLNVQVVYFINKNNELNIEYSASTDKSTPVNLTNHAFFNLAGETGGLINDHVLKINADIICSIDEEKVAISKNYSVNETPFDFRSGKSIGQGFVSETTYDQLKNAGGFDHHFVLKKINREMSLAASVVEPFSGRKMDVFTEEPCIHFFSANFFKGVDVGKMGKPINYRESFALETQSFPFSNDQNVFPSIILHPGEQYKTKTILKFSVVNDLSPRN